MLPELLGRDGQTVAADVVGTCNGKIEISAATHVDEARQRRLTRDDGHVDEPLRDIGLGAARLDVDRNPGVRLGELANEWHELSRRKARCGREPHAARERAVVVDERLHQTIVRSEYRLHALQGSLSRLRQLHRPHIAADELAAERLLKPADRAGNARDLHVKRLGGRAERAASRDGHEDAPRREVVRLAHDELRKS